MEKKIRDNVSKGGDDVPFVSLGIVGLIIIRI